MGFESPGSSIKKECEELPIYISYSLTVQGDVLQLFGQVNLRIMSLLVVSAAGAVGFSEGEHEKGMGELPALH